METELENILTNSYKEDMIRYMASHPEAFDEAVQLAISNKQPYSWRAAWLLWSCMDDNDSRIQGYIQNILDVIPNTKDGQKRELLMILSKMDFDEAFEGVVFSLCVNLWEQIHKQPSVRMKAFQLMVKIMQKYPDLYQEVELLTQDHYLDTLSPGIRYSIALQMKKMRQ